MPMVSITIDERTANSEHTVQLTRLATMITRSGLRPSP